MTPTFDDAYGYDERAIWTLPAEISPEVRAEAEEQLAVLAQMMLPARASDVKGWLASLGLLVASPKRSSDDAEARVNAYAALLEMPAAILTRETLARAARAFQWWPSFQELSEFLDAEIAPLATRRERLMQIVYGPRSGRSRSIGDIALRLVRGGK